MTEFISNSGFKNHEDKVVEMISKSDEIIVVSPFLSDDCKSIIEESKGLKKITIITNLEKYDDTASKVISLYEYSEICKNHNIDFVLKNDGKLHGKVYIFLKEGKSIGVLVTSANFTKNGFINNNEYGLFTTDRLIQEQIIQEVNKDDLITVPEKDLVSMKNDAERFLRENKPINRPKFNLSKYFSRYDSSKVSDRYQILLKKTCDSIEALGAGITKNINQRYIAYKKGDTSRNFVAVLTDTGIVYINTTISKDNVTWEEGFTKDISPNSGQKSYWGTLQFKITDEHCLDKAIKYIKEEYIRLRLVKDI